jgi:hypothetical protein
MVKTGKRTRGIRNSSFEAGATAISPTRILSHIMYYCQTKVCFGADSVSIEASGQYSSSTVFVHQILWISRYASVMELRLAPNPRPTACGAKQACFRFSCSSSCISRTHSTRAKQHNEHKRDRPGRLQRPSYKTNDWLIQRSAWFGIMFHIWLGCRG